MKKEYAVKLKELRECIQSKFDPKGGPVPCDTVGDLACEAENDLAWLNFKAGKLSEAEEFSSKALKDCEGHPQNEQKAAHYNDAQIQKALKSK